MKGVRASMAVGAVCSVGTQSDEVKGDKVSSRSRICRPEAENVPRDKLSAGPSFAAPFVSVTTKSTKYVLSPHH
jgi:hypothetical protein